MESLEKARAVADAEGYRVLLLDEELKPTAAEWRRAGLGTAVFHAAAIVILLLLPGDDGRTFRDVEMRRRVTPLLDPPTRLTQKERNKAPLSEEVSVAPAVPTVKLAPVRKRKAEPPPPQVVKKETPVPRQPQEPAKTITAQTQQAVQIAPPAVTPPPPVTPEPPKLVLEAPSAPPLSGEGTGRLKVPGSGIQEAVRELARKGASGSRSAGDNTDEDVMPDFSPSSKPTPTRSKSSIELLSDPSGVDMKPYLIRVLQSVRRNWSSIYPESARLGLRGRVVLQFRVTRDGKIAKVVFTTESGKAALDRASVAALSMSDPLPQLPDEYKGSSIVLQFNFLYNAPK